MELATEGNFVTISITEWHQLQRSVVQGAVFRTPSLFSEGCGRLIFASNQSRN